MFESIKEAGGPLDPVSNMQGVLDFANFQKIFRTIVLLTIRFMKAKTEQNRTERRALLQAMKKREYHAACQ